MSHLIQLKQIIKVYKVETFLYTFSVFSLTHLSLTLLMLTLINYVHLSFFMLHTSISVRDSLLHKFNLNLVDIKIRRRENIELKYSFEVF